MSVGDRMSERGSFVTQYIYCEKCLAVARKHLIDKEKYLCSVEIPSWIDNTSPHLPIIAGKIGGLYQGEEIHTIAHEIGPKINNEICHSLTIVVIADSGTVGLIKCNPGEEFPVLTELVP